MAGDGWLNRELSRELLIPRAGRVGTILVVFFSENAADWQARRHLPKSELKQIAFACLKLGRSPTGHFLESILNLLFATPLS